MGVAYVGLDGLEDMYGGAARLVNSLLNAAPQDLAPRVGVAHAKFPALVAAMSSTPSWSDQGSRRCRVLPCAPLHRPTPRRLHGEGCDAPLRTARHGRRGRDGVGKDGGPVRSHGQGGVEPVPWR